MDVSPSTNLYQLSRGVLSIAEYDENCATPSYDDLGNCPRMEVEVTEETLDHFSSRSGTKTKDKIVVMETGYNVNFDLDEVSKLNLRLFLKATLVGGGNKLRANQALTTEYVLKFVTDNPSGPNETWEFWRLKLKPGAAFNLVSDDWAAMSFTGEGLSDTPCHSTSPFFDVTFCTTTTTSSTTTTTS